MYNRNRRSFTKMRYDDIEVKDATRPENPNKDINLGISIKALKDLPRSNSSIIPKVDPYTNLLPKSNPYAILNKFNPIIGGNYGGVENLDGGNIEQLASSEMSTFLKCFDAIFAQAKINYRYLPIKASDTVRGKGLTDTMIRSIDEILSLTKASTFTNLAVFNYYIKTNLPLGRYTSGSSHIDGWIPVSAPEGLYAWMIYYQNFLQQLAALVSNFNRSKKLQGEMMRMSWNRQTPLLHGLFSLFQKKTFLNHWKSLAYVLNGEYFDHEWYKQTLTFANVPSRRSEAMTEPLLELGFRPEPITEFSIAIKVGEGQQERFEILYDHSNIDAIFASIPSGNWFLDPTKYPHTTFDQALESIIKCMSAEHILKWARSGEMSALDAPLTDVNLFNTVDAMVNASVEASNLFKPMMGDLRAMLDVLQRTGVNRWEKEINILVTEDTDMIVTHNLLVEDFYKAAFSGPSAMVFDGKTYRWAGKTAWNIYNGLPSFDFWSGGAFLTFSVKDLNFPVGTPDSVKSAALDYLPVMVISLLDAPVLINRLGQEAALDFISGGLNTDDHTELARLNVLRGDSLNLRVVAQTEHVMDGEAIDIEADSHLALTCEKLFGIFAFKDEDDNLFVYVDTDLLCYIDFQIEDITNKMVTYARVNGPFSVNAETENDIGFLGLNSQR